MNRHLLKGEFHNYWFKLAFFEKVNTFYKTFPNNYSGKLTIEKGQVIEKEDKREILDEVEKEYLRAVIKPFRKEIRSIMKVEYDEEAYIQINFHNYCNTSFPFFENGTMYKGMEADKEYSLEDLRL